MKKIVSILLFASLLISVTAVFSGCGGGKYEIVLLTDTGSITDKGFNQSAWDSMTEFAVQRNLDCRYFIPQSAKHEDLASQLRAAAKEGATVIFASGKIYETALYEVQREYPDIKFVLIDGRPHPQDAQTAEIPVNTTSVMFASEQSGFLAGYAAVFDGFTSLGFMGSAPDDDVRAYGYGFLQGAEYAAKQAGSGVNVFYQYIKDNEKSDKSKQTAEQMYEDGADVIFVCGDETARSVKEAAADKRSYVICADRDDRYDSGAVLTSAVKGVSSAVNMILRSVYDTKDFEYSFGGKSTYFDAANGGAGLASFVYNDKNGDAFDRFYKFSRADYEEILEKLSSKSIEVKRSISVSDPYGAVKAEDLVLELRLELVNVTVLQ
ncbi:MAG: BMP family ABC transporter substrate-binding protein [Clostridia bacterium]|nr:BMP family ABC transporter substrate-binding protein [Clostridia bacterium]